MDTNVRVTDMQLNQRLEGFYVLKSAEVKAATTNKPFLAAILVDSTGDIPLKVWNYTGEIGKEDNGKVVKVRGQVTEYKDQKQFIAQQIRLATDEDLEAGSYKMVDLVPHAPINVHKEKKFIMDTIEAMEDADYKDITRDIMEAHMERFETCPAAKSVHHSFLNGLLMHTANMLKQGKALAEIYGGTINKDLLFAGIILHDIGKLDEFIVNDLGLVSDYSIEGSLLGHLTMGAQEVYNVGYDLGCDREKVMLLQHLLLSHHGNPEWGAAVAPKCAEAFLLHYIDMIDSKMEIFEEKMKEMRRGEYKMVSGLGLEIYKHMGY